MPPIRSSAGRASKACEGCRKGKTRCYPDASGACLRCSTLNLKCSLQTGFPDTSNSNASLEPTSNDTPHDCRLIAERLASLERVVSRLTESVGLDARAELDSDASASPKYACTTPTAAGQDPPILVIQQAASEVDRSGERSATSRNIVEKGLVSVDEAGQLLALFRNNYRRWVTLREDDEAGPNLDFWGSPLLLCACCLISLRNWTGQRARETADTLFKEAKTLLGQQLLQSPQPLAFFQAVLVLSLWSTTIGQKPLSIDSWMITGFAIQHSLASAVFSERRSSLGTMLLWTRLFLSHLHACVSIRRHAVIGKADIERIRLQLQPDELTNFEMRMVAELNLYWTVHENVVATTVHIPQAQTALKNWEQTWAFLFEQPRSQFLRMGYHFAQLLMFEQALNNKSAAVRESLVSEMVRLCSAILKLAMDTSDERTRHLSDHIYHMITFAAVTLCRLLCKYEAQLRTTHDVTKLDATVLDTVRWLLLLGPDTHIGFKMGMVIEAAHHKLRPDVGFIPQPNSELEHAEQMQTMFPELSGMGMDTLDIDWESMVPDWQSLASDEASQPPGVIP